MTKVYGYDLDKLYVLFSRKVRKAKRDLRYGV